MDGALVPLLSAHHVPDGQRVGCCATLSLVCAHPKLLRCSSIRHPCKTLILLRNSHISALRQLLDVVDDDVVGRIFDVLLDDLSRRTFFDVVVPLLNAEELRESLATLLQVLDAKRIVEFIHAVPSEKTAIVLKAPGAALSAFLAATHEDRYATAVVPILHESDVVLRDTLVPLLSKCHQPELLGVLINNVEPMSVILILRGADADTLVKLMNALEFDDVNQGGALVKFLRKLLKDPELLEEKVVPFLLAASPEQFLPILRGVKARQVLEVLRRLEVEDVMRLLSNTDTDLLITVFNGPLEGNVAFAAGGLATVMRDPRAAQVVSDASKRISNGLRKADALAQDLQQEVDRKKAAASDAWQDGLRRADTVKQGLKKAVDEERQTFLGAFEETARDLQDVGQQVTGLTRGWFQQGMEAAKALQASWDTDERSGKAEEASAEATAAPRRKERRRRDK
eukprot:TRINITY_DN12127_c0_g1_i1.p1 TRINITY_DN12127_c0_g1~~TRINITY_DN12127_c0_g1_i1.p1  ORF type:complete len:455 (+),score=104.09 TRINITY_DN12127_c0_g1_i1:28-1392(+)